MIDTEALRKKVIDLAIQGKLTEQLPTDGDAETLYAQIQEEKARLVKEGKIKKDKPSAAISDDEVLFNIPSNWKWVHLNEIAVSSLGKTLNKSTDKGEPCRYLCSINVQWDEINLDTVKTARFEEDEKEKYRLCKNDLLICEGGDSGRCAIWDSDEEMYYQNALHRVRFFCDINPKLYCYIIEFYKKSGIIAFFTKGIGIQHLVQSSLNALWLPLPPLYEQERIVNKLEAVMEAIDIIDDLQEKYRYDLATLKSKIIDAGIRGKLTEQLPEDGDAETLYAQIQEEKARLIKEGKIKKEKPLGDITEDEIPFEIPKNWKWVRIASVGLTVTGTTPPKTNKGYYGNGYPFFKPSDLDAGRHISVGSESLTNEGWDVSRQLRKGSILVCCIGTIGKSAIIDVDGTTNQQINAITPILCDSDYLLYAIDNDSFQRQLQQGSRATTVTIIKKSKFDECIIPFPPINEQKRIADRINELLSMMDLVEG